MSLYNLLFGHRDAAGIVLGMLERAPEDFRRFRDAWIEVADGAPRLAVYTRLGGGNNSHDDSECNNGDTPQPESCYGCKVIEIEGWPGFTSAVDDTFDSTYRTFYFQVPERYRAEIEAVKDQLPGVVDTDERWKDMIAALDAQQPTTRGADQ